MKLKRFDPDVLRALATVFLAAFAEEEKPKRRRKSKKMVLDGPLPKKKPKKKVKPR